MCRVCVRERYEESACVRLSVCVCVCIYIYSDGASVCVRLSVSVRACLRAHLYTYHCRVCIAYVPHLDITFKIPTL